jgi:uncharacterized membrane protein
MLSEQHFLTPAEIDRLREAIQTAEQHTSGEIRVYFEKKCKEERTLERAMQMFCELQMQQTVLRNGVLLYIAYQSHHFAIIGDEAIHTVVEQKFWDEMNQIALEHFKNQKHIEGLELVIARIGAELKKYFPVLENDQNELADDIIIK